MNTPLENFFPAIFCLTLERREDRREHAKTVFRKIGIEPHCVRWIFGLDKPLDHTGKPNGNTGCTAGHRMILDEIVNRQIPKALVFEDDFDIAFTDPLQCQRANKNPALGFRLDPQKWFAATEPEIPSDWDILYLGGQYAEMPQKRVSAHLIRTGRMLTTSSYGITLAFARKLRPSIEGIGPIDCLYSGFLREAHSYCLEPRIFNQYASVSDLRDEFSNPAIAMTDQNHVKALDEGRVYK